MPSIQRRLTDLVYPRRCMLCRRFLGPVEARVCPECLNSLPEPFSGSLRGGHYKRWAAALWYEEPLREAFLRYKFGGCRFVVAEPSDDVERIDDSYARLGVMKVATKYPNITRAYYDSIGTQVEIVKLHGNIELAPLCQLADRIVDITATGTTLRENNLTIVDDVLESTARFIANPASVRVDGRVRDVANALAEAVG